MQEVIDGITYIEISRKEYPAYAKACVKAGVKCVPKMIEKKVCYIKLNIEIEEKKINIADIRIKSKIKNAILRLENRIEIINPMFHAFKRQEMPLKIPTISSIPPKRKNNPFIYNIKSVFTPLVAKKSDISRMKLPKSLLEFCYFCNSSEVHTKVIKEHGIFMLCNTCKTHYIFIVQTQD